MGWCGTSPAEAANTPCARAECEQIGADYYENRPTISDPDGSDGPGTCLVLSSLATERERILVSTLLYPSLLRLRDEVFPRSRFGRSILTEFDRHYKEAVSILRSDQALLTELIEFMIMIQPLTRAILGEDASRSAYAFGDTLYTYNAQRLRPGVAAAVESLMTNFAERATDDFRRSLESYRRILPPFVGIASRDILSALRETELVDTEKRSKPRSTSRKRRSTSRKSRTTSRKSD
jgi:hypothetical protein